jgi:hypothetical protein
MKIEMNTVLDYPRIVEVVELLEGLLSDVDIAVGAMEEDDARLERDAYCLLRELTFSKEI